MTSVNGFDVEGIKNYGKCWYTFPDIPASVKREQFRQMLNSSLLGRLGPWGKIVFVYRYLSMLKKKHVIVKACAEERGISNKNIVSDYAGIVSGYEVSIDMFGREEGHALFGEMFLSIGSGEMAWLWPEYEVFDALDDPFEAIKAYWKAYLDAAQDLSLIDYEIVEDDRDTFRTDITYSAYDDLLFGVGCPELSSLNSEAELSAMKTSFSSSDIVLTKKPAFANEKGCCAFVWKKRKDDKE
ncbi:hypothetical protein OO006_10130 [Prosthecochloris sp. SCSIO W1101]|uniref:hypothetical protein n=1 Tax=Prosthecochloris sp. SCSIO W1101 TaxID=2992242 RepID=UPI00223E6309|nr:hypothetical protein [Prosthecochloris sp. SCSIO W1101]UZJ40706.1 hypothetical protein OO006_10130 [Prosthecochloris sp. SCSIO W1101]